MWHGTCKIPGVAIHINPVQNHSIAKQPVSQTPAKTAANVSFSKLLNGITSNQPTQRTSTVSATSSSTANTTTPTPPNPISIFQQGSGSGNSGSTATPVSSDGTSLANLMAAASYAGVPYADLSAQFNATSNGSYDPNWQTKLANALETRLQSVAGQGTSNQIYDPNPANDSVPFDPTNLKPFFSSSAQINGLLSNMWSAVHAGDVNGYHTALQQVDAWYQSNGQQNYYTGLTDGQVAAYNPANGINPSVAMPNANASVAAAELSAIKGQSASATNLAAIAQAATSGTIKT